MSVPLRARAAPSSRLASSGGTEANQPLADLSLEGLLAAELQVSQLCATLGRGPVSSVSRTAASGATSSDAVARDVRLARSRLQALERAVDTLRERAIDQTTEVTGEEEQNQRMNQIEKHAIIVEDLHGTLRTSILRARAELERAAVAARQELIGGNDPAAAQRRQKQLASSSAAEKSAAFTRSLHRTRSMLSDEIARSSSALSTLTSSTRVLGDTASEHRTYGQTVKLGGRLITKQLQRERTDKALIAVGLLFFTLVVCYIVNKRLAPFLFWWTTFFVAKTAPNASNIATTHATQHTHSQTVYPSTPSHTQIHATHTTPSVPYTPTPEPITPGATAHQSRTHPSTTTAAEHQRNYAQQQQRQQAHVHAHHADSTHHASAAQFGHMHQGGSHGVHAYDAPPLHAHTHAHGHAHDGHAHYH